MNDNSLKSIGRWIFITGTIASTIWLLAFSPFPFTGRIILASIASLGLSLYKKGYQKSLPTTTEALKEDDRKPILFLRAFDRDGYGSFRLNKSVLDRVSLDPASHIFDIKNVEQIIVDIIRPFGPVIAIGKPGEDLPPIGAYRHYTDFDEDWQETVLRYMQQSSLIVMVLDFSEGVLWELRQIIVNKRLKDTIIFYPTTFGVSDDSTFDELWDDNFKKYIKEFPFLVTPKIGTMGLTFSNTRKPIELWSLELNFDQKIKEIETIIFERFEEKPLTPGSFIQVGIPVRR